MVGAAPLVGWVRPEVAEAAPGLALAKLPAGLPAIPAELAPSTAQKTVIYSMGQMRIWAFEPGYELVKTHLVSGRYGNPPPGRYHVFSKSTSSFAVRKPEISWMYMVRFAKTPRGNNIGFHQIPLRCDKGKPCEPVQSEADLGSPRSSGCVRQKERDARWMYNWADIGTEVIVIH